MTSLRSLNNLPEPVGWILVVRRVGRWSAGDIQLSVTHTPGSAAALARSCHSLLPRLCSRNLSKFLYKEAEVDCRPGSVEDVLFVLDQGSGPAVVLLPILGSDHRMYAAQVEGLRDEFRCLAVDLRGCGESPTLDGVPEGDVLRTQAQDIVDALDERGIESAHVVGISYGGVVAETLLLDHGERVASAVICDSFCDTRPRGVPERLLMAGAKVQPLLFRLPKRWLVALERRLYRRWPEAGRAVADTLVNSRRDDLVKQRRAVNAIRLEDRLRHCVTPTLCLAGAAMPTGVTMMRRVHEALPVSEFMLIEDSVDPSNLCQPELFTKTVAEWVRQHDSSSRGDLPR